MHFLCVNNFVQGKWEIFTSRKSSVISESYDHPVKAVYAVVRYLKTHEFEELLKEAHRIWNEHRNHDLGSLRVVVNA